MSSIGSFGTFTQARLGIYAAQKALSVTGNNISNINTLGYTRQALDQVSLKTGGADRYAAKYDVKVGNGVLCTGVSQLRDPYLDIRYRTEMASVGAMEGKLEGLNEIAAILNEVAKGDDDYGIVEAQFSDFADTLRQLSRDSGQEDFDSLARSSADTLCTLLNKYAGQLEELRQNKIDSLKEDVAEINKILTSIQTLNANIRKSNIHGDNALEMRDDRNVLIDQLSEYMKIDVTYEMEDVGAGVQVEKLVIKLGNANPDTKVDTDSSTLVDGIYVAQFEMPEQVPALNQSYDPSYEPADPGNLTDEDKLKVYKYLDENGDPVEDIEDAGLADNTNYDLSLTKLLDAKGREWQDIGTTKKVVNAQGTDGTITYTDGNIQVTKETSYVQGADNKWYEVVKTTKTSLDTDLDDNDLYGKLQATREMLTEEGEFATAATIANVDESAAIKRGIPYYQKSLDLLARKFAEEFNKLNQGYYVDENGNYLQNNGKVDENGKPVYDPIEVSFTYYVDKNGAYLGTTTPTGTAGTDYFEREGKLSNAMTETEKQAFEDSQGVSVEDYLADPANKTIFDGGNLFSIQGDTDNAEGITASNITVSKSWSTGDVHIITTFIKPFGGELENTTQDENVDHMITLMDKSLVYNPKDLEPNAQSSHLFEGSFQKMLTNMNSVLGKDQKSTSIELNAHSGAATELDVSRDGVSGVDLNDEAMNLMQYQKAYSAACRLMTTIDSVLDRLINYTAM